MSSPAWDNSAAALATQHAALFHAVLAGLGQFGIVVEARIKLAPARQLARVFTLQYPDVSSLLDDARIAVLSERFDHVEAQVNPDASGQYGSATMFAVKYFNPGTSLSNAALLANLQPASSEVADLPYAAFLGRIDPVVDLTKTVGAWGLPHPFFDVFLPDATVDQFLGEVVSTLTIDDTGNGPVVIYPLRRSKLRQQFLRMPDGRDEVLFLFDILAFAPPVPAVVAQLVAQEHRLDATGARSSAASSTTSGPPTSSPPRTGRSTSLRSGRRRSSPSSRSIRRTSSLPVKASSLHRSAEDACDVPKSSVAT